MKIKEHTTVDLRWNEVELLKIGLTMIINRETDNKNRTNYLLKLNAIKDKLHKSLIT